MRNVLIAAIASLFSIATLAQSPTIEELEADPNYTRVDSATISGECEQNAILGDMIKSRDAVKKLHKVKCDHIIYSKPPEKGVEQRSGLIALARQPSGGTAYFKGDWDADGYLEMEFTEVSFDQETWHPVVKGRLRTYGSDAGSTMMMIFAVFEVEKSGGKKRNEGIAVAFLP
jgi:hypothetical protein